MENGKIKDNNSSEANAGFFIGLLVTIFVFVYVLIEVTGITKLNRNDEIRKIKSQSTLIENVNGKIQKLTNQDVVDYFIKDIQTSVEETIFVDSFIDNVNNEKVLNHIFRYKKDPSIQGFYFFIDNQWYIENITKEKVSKEDSIAEINSLVKSLNITLESQKAIKNSWEKK